MEALMKLYISARFNKETNFFKKILNLFKTKWYRSKISYTMTRMDKYNVTDDFIMAIFNLLLVIENDSITKSNEKFEVVYNINIPSITYVFIFTMNIKDLSYIIKLNTLEYNMTLYKTDTEDFLNIDYPDISFDIDNFSKTSSINKENYSFMINNELIDLIKYLL